MKTNQTFIGAYARSRRGQSSTSSSEAVGHQEAAVPVDDAAPTQPSHLRHDESSAESIAHSHSTPTQPFSADPSPNVYETTPAWIDELGGQVLRIDPAVMPSPRMRVGEVESATADNLAAAAPDQRHDIESRFDELRDIHSEVSAPGDAPSAFAEQLTENFAGQISEQLTELGFADATVADRRNIDQGFAIPRDSDSENDQPFFGGGANPSREATQPAFDAPKHEAIQEHATVERHAIDELTSEGGPAGQESPVATQDRWNGAAWEVDAFDVPHNVAELFFEEVFFRSIAEHMEQSVHSGLRSVLVTSIAAGEGRSTVSIGTAIAAAASGLRVALIDVDLDAPSQHDQLRLELESDWVTAIRQGESLESVAITSIEDAVTLLPLMPIDGHALPVTEMEIDRLLARLDGCFDLILFDGPSIRSWATARIAAAVDSSLIVRDARSTTKADVSHAAQRLRRQGVQGIGVVDNFCG